MSLNRRVTFAALIFALVFAATSSAQPPGFGGRGGGDRGGGRGGRGGGPSGFFGGGGGNDDRASEFRRRMMERMDSNRNGKLEESEVSSRARPFLEGMMRQSGKTLKFPLSISEAAGGSSRSRDRGRDRDRGRGRDKEKDDDEFEYPLVKGFGEKANYTSFGVDPNLLNGRTVDIERMYDDGVMSTLDRTMERYDKDKNGVLEYEEWREIPWQSDPRDSDLDSDGRLTRAEMAERYKQRNGSSESRSRSDRGRGSDRGGDRGRGSDRGGDRGRGSDRGGRSGFSPFGGGFSPFGGGSPFGGFGRGGDSGRGGRGGDRGGRGGSSRGGFDPEAMLKRFDSDGDGYIDFSKVPEPMKRFIGGRLESTPRER